jgi:glycerol-3-phosphate dehydrogenase (NAD+)
MKELFQHKFFRVDTTQDVNSVELCGAVKNIIAMGAGFCDGLGVGPSTKSAVIRRGIQEMALFCQLYSPTFDVRTIFSSCGIADVIASSIGGRNRKCSEQFVKEYQTPSEINNIFMNEETKERKELNTIEAIKNKWMRIEKKLLNGQKMQGLTTLEEFIQCINYINVNNTITKSLCVNTSNTKSVDVSNVDISKEFILFQRIYDISFLGANPTTLFEW